MIRIHNKPHRFCLLSFIGTIGLTLIASSIKISFIVGSFYSFFSINNSVAPLAGAFGGVAGSFLLSFIRLITKFYTTGSLIPLILILQLPTLGACLYWASSSPLVRVLVPAACMILFGVHPVGSLAWTYSLLWLIPIALHLVPKKGIFLDSLGSTYIAHAIGSVIWLYSKSMPPAVWIALIPVALTERTLFAMGMTATYYAMVTIEQRYAPKIMRLFTRTTQPLSS